MNVLELPLRLQKEVVCETRRRSLYAFHLQVFEILHGATLDPAPYIEAVCYSLEQVLLGTTSRLINTMPPRHGKSEMGSISFVLWAAGHDPSLKFMLVSYGLDLCRESLDKVRTVMSDPRYQEIFPETRMSPSHKSRDVIRTTKGGEVRAISTGGPVTGFGTDIIIIDDLSKADEALTVAGREAAIRFYKNSLLSRFNTPAAARIIILGQRLHEDDIVGHVLGLGVPWQHLNLPAIAEQDELIPIGRGRVWSRKKNDLLHPSRMSRALLEERRLEYGDRYFGAQFQQNPIVADGALIRLEWFGQYDEMPPRSFFHRIVQSWDPAYTDGPNSDYSAGQTWGLRDDKWYMLDSIRERLRFHDLKTRVLAWHRQWKADALVIEGGSVGDALWEEVKAERIKGYTIAPRPVGSKVDRLAGKTAQLASGNYLLPKSAPWLADVRHEFVAFPEGRHDDQVDALTQMLEFVFSRREWVQARYDADGRRIRKARVERRSSSYYDGDVPSRGSW